MLLAEGVRRAQEGTVNASGMAKTALTDAVAGG